MLCSTQACMWPILNISFHFWTFFLSPYTSSLEQLFLVPMSPGDPCLSLCRLHSISKSPTSMQINFPLHFTYSTQIRTWHNSISCFYFRSRINYGFLLDYFINWVLNLRSMFYDFPSWFSSGGMLVSLSAITILFQNKISEPMDNDLAIFSSNTLNFIQVMLCLWFSITTIFCHNCLILLVAETISVLLIQYQND